MKPSSDLDQPNIVVLPPELASQIAAGEVVERPASVVKELVENALDAGATRIDVSIEGGGIGLIEVADDGSGMNPKDARLCVERHATSKLRRFTDLEELRSYGFRGEALPSIASVARLSVRTRDAASDEGLLLVTEGGSEPSLQPTAAPVGTTVRVADLFFNVPARRKFLRSSATEAGHVTDVLLDAALSRPEVAFTLTRDGRKVRSWHRCSGYSARIEQLFPDEELLVCRGERGPLEVQAWLSRPERARQGAAGLKLLVNGRPIRDRGLSGTIAHAYGSVLERGRFPRGILQLTLSPRLVDINVHPQKAEVRFADPRAVSDAVHSIISRELAQRLARPPQPRGVAAAFAVISSRGEGDEPLRTPRAETPSAPQQSPPTEALSRAQQGSFPERAPSTAQPSLPKEVSNPAQRGSSPQVHPEQDGRPNGSGSSSPKPPPAQPSESWFHSAPTPSVSPLRLADSRGGAVAWGKLRFLTQVRETYLICEGADGLYVLDQHAADERVVFSKLRRHYHARDIASQTLLFPVTVEVTPLESDLLENHAEQVAAVGLEVRIRTPEVVSIHAVPRLLQGLSPERLLRDLLGEVTRAEERAFSDRVDKALATLACHAAVRAGDALSEVKAQALLAALDQADFAAYCPHGRPIVTFTSWEELERKVGRR